MVTNYSLIVVHARLSEMQDRATVRRNNARAGLVGADHCKLAKHAVTCTVWVNGSVSWYLDEKKIDRDTLEQKLSEDYFEEGEG